MHALFVPKGGDRNPCAQMQENVKSDFRGYEQKERRDFGKNAPR